MKIQEIQNFQYAHTVFKQNKKRTVEKFLEPKNLGLGSALLGAAVISGTIIIKKNTPNKYLKTLAADLSRELKKDIKPSDLKSVITTQEFKKIAKSLKEENYISSPENIKNGMFQADFHSHSNYSDGVTSVEDIMNQAAEYGDKLQRINGKKFLFALSDHDGVKGVKEALKIIANNPEKFKNIKFIPAAELSMPMPCEVGSFKHNKFKNDVEMFELLIYGINPFSKTSDEYFSHLYEKRKNGVRDSLKLAREKIPNVKFSEEEFDKFYTKKKVKYCMLNQHWRIFQYINLKARITQTAKEQNKNPEELYMEIMPELKRMGSCNAQNFDKYLEQNNIKISTKTYLDDICKLTYDICPNFKGPVLWAPYESSFENVIGYANKEDAFLAFAHPGFTIQNMRQENVLEQIKKYMDKSKGRLIYSETFHQAYPPNNITEEDIKQTSKIMNEAGLISIGGRDSHKNNFKFNIT